MSEVVESEAPVVTTPVTESAPAVAATVATPEVTMPVTPIAEAAPVVAIESSSAEQWEAARTKYGEKKFGDLTTKEAQAALKELGRYATEADVYDALLEAKRVLRSGKIEKGVPKDATPEQVSEWRQANGIPEKVEAYFEKLPNGLVIGDDDMPVFVDFAQSLHGVNAKPEHIHAAVEWYNGHMQSVAEQRAVQDVNFQDEAKVALKAQYGGSYEKNLNIANNHIANMFGEEQVALLQQARAPDGRKLFDIPEVVHGFLKAGLEIDPSATVAPSGGGGVGAIDGEIAKLEERLKTDRAGFYADGLNKRHDELLSAKAKAKAR